MNELESFEVWLTQTKCALKMSLLDKLNIIKGFFSIKFVNKKNSSETNIIYKMKNDGNNTWWNFCVQTI